MRTVFGPVNTALAVAAARRVPSTARADEPESEPGPPGSGSARVAALPVASAREEPASSRSADLFA